VQSIDCPERTDKKQELSANTVAFISCKMRNHNATGSSREKGRGHLLCYDVYFYS
jgi:hypothetical protein